MNCISKSLPCDFHPTGTKWTNKIILLVRHSLDKNTIVMNVMPSPLAMQQKMSNWKAPWAAFSLSFQPKCWNIPQELNLFHQNSQSCCNCDKLGKILVAAEVGGVDKMAKKWPFTSLMVLTAHLAVFNCFWMLFCWKKCWSLTWVAETCFIFRL